MANELINKIKADWLIYLDKLYPLKYVKLKNLIPSVQSKLLLQILQSNYSIFIIILLWQMLRKSTHF